MIEPEGWSSLIGWMSVVGLVSLLTSLVAMPWILARLPADYFVRPEKPAPRSPWTRLLGLARNLVGLLLILAGVLESDPTFNQLAKIMAFVAVIFASINVVGGFLVTGRMLKMFQRK